jgi:acetyltransferase EpsM
VKWLVYGARPLYTAEIAEIVARCGDTFVGAVDNMETEDQGASAESSRFSVADLANERINFDSVVLSAGPPGIRKILRDELRELNIDRYENLIDPTATVASSARISSGVSMNAHVVVGAEAALEEFVQINRSSSVGHHSRLSTFVTLGPGVTVASSVSLGAGVFVGAGATILPHVTIGANATVGAGAVVIEDVPAFAVVVGHPARIARTDTHGYLGYTV